MKEFIVTVAPREPWSDDEGLTLRVILPARSKDHAVKRVLRYMDGAVTGCKVHKARPGKMNAADWRAWRYGATQEQVRLAARKGEP